MNKKILIAMDESENARRSVMFAAKMFDKNDEITLFSVLPDHKNICSFESQDLTPSLQRQQEALCTLENEKKGLLEKTLNESHRELLDAGFADDHVHQEIKPAKKNVAQDIINKADTGFDAVLIGKRGISATSAFLFGSVSQKVLQGVNKASVLVVS